LKLFSCLQAPAQLFAITPFRMDRPPTYCVSSMYLHCSRLSLGGLKEPATALCRLVSYGRSCPRLLSRPCVSVPRVKGYKAKKPPEGGYFWKWSGRRDSNPRPQPWQGCALPLSYTRTLRLFFSTASLPGTGDPRQRKPEHFSARCVGRMVEPGGIEPPTSCMPCKRSPS
jgi:hypothetical protein